MSKGYLVGEWVKFNTNTTPDDLYKIGEIISINLNKEGKPILYLIENKVMRYEIYPEQIIGEYNQ